MATKAENLLNFFNNVSKKKKVIKTFHSLMLKSSLTMYITLKGIQTTGVLVCVYMFPCFVIDFYQFAKPCVLNNWWSSVDTV